MRRLEESGHPTELKGEEVDHRQVIAELKPCELTWELDFERGEDEEDAERVHEARIELGDLPGRHPAFERVVDPKASDKIVCVPEGHRDTTQLK